MNNPVAMRVVHSARDLSHQRDDPARIIAKDFAPRQVNFRRRQISC